MKLAPNWLLKSVAAMFIAGATLALLAVPAFFLFDQYYPPPLPGKVELSTEVVDADGKLLRAFATSQGRWRLKTGAGDVNPEFLKLLIAYEDQRFWSHSGVDIRALLRASVQLISNGRIVSGGSTLTMQLARLLEPRKRRSLGSKLSQIVRALQLERRLSKAEILDYYLMLAPYGGNIEGVRAASLAYFGKEPKGLTLAQSAMLVALPQSPERRRPDRFAKTATKARNKVLARVAAEGIIAPGEVARAARTKVSAARFALPQYAPHLARRLVRAAPELKRHVVTLKRPLQKTMEKIISEAARRFAPEVSLALVLADARTGNILAEVGSPDYLSTARSGWVDMTGAMRSPGSTLKPFIYGLGFEEGLARPETMIVDAPANFAGYRPQNFDMKYQGEVSIRRALQLSLNVPAVLMLEAVGPARLLSRFKQAGIAAVVPRSNRPGLSIGLGGIGITLKQLVQLYTGFANGGPVVRLRNQQSLPIDARSISKPQLLDPVAAWHVTDILSGTPPPTSSRAKGIAYKTGTSYGYRDAWSVGYDGRYVLGVWVGRADNGPVPGITGRTAAAPILFEAFTKTGFERVPFKQAPAGALRLTNTELPITLQRFGRTSNTVAKSSLPESPPQIVYPPASARIELDKSSSGQPMPLVLKLQNGRPPFRWLANGQLLPTRSRRRIASWLPDGSGFSTLTVIDAGGRAASVDVYIKVQN